MSRDYTANRNLREAISFTQNKFSDAAVDNVGLVQIRHSLLIFLSLMSTNW